MKTSPKRSFSVIENERFGLIFAKTVSIISASEDVAQVSYVQPSSVESSIAKRVHNISEGSNVAQRV